MVGSITFFSRKPVPGSPRTTTIALAILTRPCPDSLLGTKLEPVGPKMSPPLTSSALISAALENGGGHVG